MTYMPELKDELVRAAGAPRTATRRPPRRFLRQATPGRLAPALGALIAVAVARAALVVAHPGTKEPVPGGSSGSARTARLASLTASETLNGFSLPPGAVASRVDPSRPRQLGSPSQELPSHALAQCDPTTPLLAASRKPAAGDELDLLARAGQRRFGSFLRGIK